MLHKNEDLSMIHSKVAVILAQEGFEIVDNMKDYF